MHLALVRHPPIGKKKFPRDGRNHGRNELIAESVKKETAWDDCGRKKISSHGQVLKKIFEGYPAGTCLSCLK